MTSAEWSKAFAKGDPEAFGHVILAAIRHAHREQAGTHASHHAYVDIGELATGFDRDPVLALCTRVGQLLREEGLTYPGEEPPE